MKDIFPEDRPWPVWQRCLFRFLFVFMILMIDPLSWFGSFVPDNPLVSANDSVRAAAVEWSNRHLFHLRPVLVQPYGSGDTSFVWASVWLSLLLSLLIMIVWSFLDRRRPAYRQLGYWFRTFIRYTLIAIAARYGSFKLNLAQMGTLRLVDMATPVGNLSLMRMCWYFMAASPPYQFFSGLMEVVVALLLLCRRTVTLGLLLGLVVFGNVMMLNMAYDIPVKILSGLLVLCCVILLFRDYHRMLAFFVLNKPAPATRLYDPVSKSQTTRILRWVLKPLFILGVFIVPGWNLVQSEWSKPPLPAIPEGFHYGVYRVNRFLVNGDSTGASRAHRPWSELVFDPTGAGTLTGDSSLFKYRYGHSGFRFAADTFAFHQLKLTPGFTDNPADPHDSLRLIYEPMPGTGMRFRTRLGTDSILIETRLTDSSFRLGKWQFHWLTEHVP